MNIGILLTDFSPGRMGGVETYVRNLVHHLVASESDNRYTLICHDGNADYFAHLADRVGMKIFQNRKQAPGRLFRSLVRKVSGIDLVQVAVDRLGLDLLHNPFTAVRSSRFATPAIVTFHDLQHRYLPHFFRPKEIRDRDAAYGKAAREAVHLIAVSSFTAETIHTCYGVPREKISVIPLGVSPDYRPRDDAGLTELRREHGLTRPFLYYPAATWPHKNHAALLDAFRHLLLHHAFDGDLVLTGVATRSRGVLTETVTRLGIADRVRILGYLPYEDLPALYSMARLLVFPSLFEGFGMPVLEAMACGCPVACSNVTSLPEVAGDAADYFDPSSPDDIARTVLALWSDDARRTLLRTRGLRRAAAFSWEATALATGTVYQTVAAGCQVPAAAVQGV